jgi:signal transduction histidine kinase
VDGGQPEAEASRRRMLPERARRQILDELERRLQSVRSPIVASPEAIAQLRMQVCSVLDDVVDGRPRESDLPDEPASLVLATQIGTLRAVQGVHPTESLRAATALFEIALPMLTRECVTEAEGTPGAARIAVSLHRTIMSRVVQAAVPYVNFLLSKLYRAHREERERMARELHDRAAHAVGVGLQDLELYQVYAAREPERARQKFEAAEDALREALQTIRQLSAELRESVGSRGLEEALQRYLRANVRPEVDVSFSSEGDTSTLTGEVREELYLVLREAVRNALLHGHASAVRVEVELTDSELRAAVGDNGKGFDVTDPLEVLDDDGTPSPVGVGLASMRERLDLLGGTLTVSSDLGVGTTVEARLPLSRAPS